jgi:hypothetical protein
LQALHCLKPAAAAVAHKPQQVQAAHQLGATARFRVQREQRQQTRLLVVAVRETRQHQAQAVQELFT